VPEEVKHEMLDSGFWMLDAGCFELRDWGIGCKEARR
jgi:hypothetical protein